VARAEASAKPAVFKRMLLVKTAFFGCSMSAPFVSFGYTRRFSVLLSGFLRAWLKVLLRARLGRRAMGRHVSGLRMRSRSGRSPAGALFALLGQDRE
jgi:hypothetical protein